MPRRLWHAHAPSGIFVRTIGQRRRAHILLRAVIFQVKQPRDERDGHSPCPPMAAPAVDVDHLARDNSPLELQHQRLQGLLLGRFEVRNWKMEKVGISGGAPQVGRVLALAVAFRAVLADKGLVVLVRVARRAW